MTGIPGDLVHALELGCAAARSVPWPTFRADAVAAIHAAVLPPDPDRHAVWFGPMELGRNRPVHHLPILGLGELVQVGLLMGAASRAINQVNSWSSIVMIVLMLPGMFGDFLPPPEPVVTIMKLIPTSYMVEAINQGMSGSATLSSVAIDLGVLAATSLAAFGAVI